MIMSHGIGVAIAKQVRHQIDLRDGSNSFEKMLCQLSWNTTEYAAIGTALVGVVFLGVPHKTANKNHLADQFVAIRKSYYPKASRKVIEALKSHNQGLLDLAERFEGIELDIDLMTIHESKMALTSNTPIRKSSSTKKGPVRY